MNTFLRSLSLAATAALACFSAAQTQLIATDQGGAAVQVNTFDLSPDGRFVVFSTTSANIVGGDGNGLMDVFWKDLQANIVVRVSVSSIGGDANGPSLQPKVSADGRYVAFTSDASNLVAADGNGTTDVFIRDVQLGTTQRVSVSTAAAEGNAGSNSPVLSDDGRFVAFTSTATNLDVRANAVGVAQVFLRDRALGTTVAVSVTSGGAIANGPSSCLSISADGRLVLMNSTAQNLGGPVDAVFDLFLHDTTTRLTRILSTDPSGFLPFSGGSFGALSRDGRYAVLGITRTSTDEVVLSRADLFTGWVDFVSRDTFGNTKSDEFVRSAAISGDGRYVAWSSSRSDYTPDDTNGAVDVFVRDMSTGTTRRMNFGPNAAEANAATSSTGPLVVVDGGRSVAYMSTSSNLGPTNPGLVAAFLSNEPETFTHDLVLADLQQRSILIGDMGPNRLLNWEWASRRPNVYWVARGVGDFNNDGKPDVLVQNTVTRQLYAGIMDREVIVSWNLISQVPNAGWQVMGVGDFTNNGRSSILFQQTSSRRMSVGIMDGTTILSWADISQIPNAPWQIAAVGDMNTDGFADILFQHGTSNGVTIAYCQGAVVQSWANLSQVPAAGWKLRATGRFGGAPGLDLAFQNASGAISLAFCQNNVVDAWANLTGPGARYRVVGAGPF